MLQQTLNQLDEVRDLLMALGRKTARERVATYIRMVVRYMGGGPDDSGSGDIALPLSRGEMADFLGLTIETVSRKMTELRKERIVDFSNPSSLRVLSQQRLKEASGD